MFMNKINFFINIKNIYFNLDKIDILSNNVIFVTGLSGSGKTTFAKKLSKEYEATLFELDNLGGFFGEYKESEELIHSLTAEFLNINYELREIIRQEKYVDLKIKNFDKYIYWTNKYIEFLLKYAKEQKRIFVFEGTQIFKCISAEKISNNPLIIIGTSSFISMLRRIKRHYKIDKARNKPNFFKKHLWKLLNDSKRLHFKDFKELNRFLAFYRNSCHQIATGEIAVAGDGNTENQSYYLYKGLEYWSLSPHHVTTGGRAFMFDVSYNGHSNYNRVISTGAVAPVINLTTDYVKNMIGTGIMTDPYRASDVTP